MAGNATFESASTSSSELGFSGSYLNGQRGVRSAAIGANLVRSGNFREGSESRVFGSGFSVSRGGSSAVVASGDSRTLSQCVSLEPIVIHDQVSWYDEVSRVMAAREKPLPPVAFLKDVKRLRSSVEDTCVKARVRANKMDDCLRNLDKYCEASTSKKQQKSELMSNDRAGAVNLKMGTQIYSINQRVEDQPKNILLNKRVRTSVAESRAECQSNGLQMQPVAMAKDGKLLEENGGGSDLFEKIRKLAAGGEGWDKKIKRKRSVGMVFTRTTDSDGVPKRPAQNKIVNERGSQPRDANIHRLNSRDDSLNNRKRSMPPGSSSPPMAQWSGQRPQKMARLKKPNLVPFVSNQDQNLLSFENHSPSDVGTRLTSNGTYGSPVSKNTTNGTQKLMVKLDNLQSSPRLSENDESVGGESRLVEKKMGNGEVDAVAKKNKPPINAAPPKPFQSSKTGYKKNGSKPGRRLKKLSDRKGFSNHASLQNRSPDCTGASDDDREELLAAANHARIASHLACSSPLWKRTEPVFAPVSSESKSFLSQQVGLLNDDSASNPLRNPHTQHQETKSFSGRNDSEKASNVSVPFYQRVLSALIMVEDNNNTLEERDSRDAHPQNTFHFNESNSFHSNGNTNSSRSPIINNTCEEDTHSEDGVDGFSSSQYENMSLDEKVLLELQSIGLFPDTLVGPVFPVYPDLVKPSLNNKEDEAIQLEVDNLKSNLHQQEVKKKAYLEKISVGVESSNSGVRELEIRAMDRLVELAYRKNLQATRRSSRSAIHKVPKQTALAFGRRTLARCHKFEKTGSSCFNEPPFQDILNAPIETEPDPKLLSDETFTTNRPTSNRGKKKELSLDDIGIPAARTVSTTTKSRKPKQKTGRVPTSNTGPTNNNKQQTRSLHPTGPTYPSSNIPNGQSTNTRIDVRFVSSHGRTEETNPTNPPFDGLDPLDELGVVGGGDLVGPTDLNSFLNFDDQDMDEDFAGGLDIPMDDLTELF